MTPDIAPILAKAWGVPDSLEISGQTKWLSVCRWRHALPELPDVPLPANTLAMSMCDARSWRIQGRRTEPAALGPGRLGLIAQGSHGRWTFDREIDVFHFYLSDETLGRMAEENGLKRYSGLVDNLQLYDPFLTLLAREAAQACSDGVRSRLYASTLSAAIGQRLIRSHAGTGFPFPAASKGSLAPWQLSRVIDYMKAQLATDPTLEDLGRLVGLSACHLARSFKLAMGVPPHRYLIDQRIDKACTLLAETTRSVAEIALSVGYDDPSYFSRLFKRHTGATPLAYRRERRS